MRDLTTFIISNTKYLKINPECIHDDECKFCANIDIYYVDEEKNINIRFGYEHFPSFCYFIAEYGFIQKLIKNQMVLDKLVIGDPGIEWNKYPKGIRGTKATNEFHFFGNSHKQVPPYFDGWMYNDKDGNVILEITPFYPWHGEKKKSNPDFITYKQFMKDYQPTLKTLIPKENLEQWITQARELKKKHYPELESK
jgi:hypothetical protein